MNWENISLEISSDVKELMDERGIKEDDVKQVICYCEENNDKLYNEEGNRFLAKKKLGDFTVYAEYSIVDEIYVLHATYGHRVQFISEIEE